MVLLCGFSVFSLPKGTPKVHQAGLKNWQPAVAPYQKSCETTHGLIIFFIIDTIATGQRSPAGPRRLGTATRISTSLFRRLSVFFESTPDQGPKAAKFAVLIPGHAGFPKRVKRSEGSDTTPNSLGQELSRTERKNSNITKLQTDHAAQRGRGASEQRRAKAHRCPEGSLRSLGAPMTKPQKRQSTPF